MKSLRSMRQGTPGELNSSDSTFLDVQKLPLQGPQCEAPPAMVGLVAL